MPDGTAELTEKLIAEMVPNNIRTKSPLATNQKLRFNDYFFLASQACAFLRYSDIGIPCGHFSSHSKHSTQLVACSSFERLR
jgi:hypothetical protein